MRELDNEDRQREARTQALLLGNPALNGGASPVAAAPAAVSPAVARVVSALGAPAASSPDTTGKIYNNDEPSPLDPPSGQDRVNMISTILGEENTPQGQAGVANVIRNRAVDGGYGGDTPSAVVQAPNQFEPWTTSAGRTRMATASADPSQVAAADAAIKSAYGEGGPARRTIRPKARRCSTRRARRPRSAVPHRHGRRVRARRSAILRFTMTIRMRLPPSPAFARVAAAFAAPPDNAALPAAAAPTQGLCGPRPGRAGGNAADSSGHGDLHQAAHCEP